MSTATQLRPFRVEVPEEDVADLRRRVAATDVLDDISLYWLTNSAVSSARLYWENKYDYFSSASHTTNEITLPVGVSVFPGEIYRAPRSWAERAYSQLVYFNEVDRGGHFAAWEQPELFTDEIRAAFRRLR